MTRRDERNMLSQQPETWVGLIQERAARSRLPLHSLARPLAAGTMGRGSGEKSFTMVIMNVETVARLLTQPLGMQTVANKSFLWCVWSLHGWCVWILLSFIEKFRRFSLALTFWQLADPNSHLIFRHLISSSVTICWQCKEKLTDSISEIKSAQSTFITDCKQKPTFEKFHKRAGGWKKAHVASLTAVTPALKGCKLVAADLTASVKVV